MSEKLYRVGQVAMTYQELAVAWMQRAEALEAALREITEATAGGGMLEWAEAHRQLQVIAQAALATGPAKENSDAEVRGE